MSNNKETVELGKFLGMTVNGVALSTKGDLSVLERISNLTPALIYSPTGLGGVDQVDDEVKEFDKADFDTLDQTIHNELTAFNEPARSILAKSLASAVGTVGATVNIGGNNEAAQA